MTRGISQGSFVGMITFADSPGSILILGPLSSHTHYASHHHASPVQTRFITSQHQIWKTGRLPKYHMCFLLPSFSVWRFSGAPLVPRGSPPQMGVLWAFGAPSSTFRPGASFLWQLTSPVIGSNCASLYTPSAPAFLAPPLFPQFSH